MISNTNLLTGITAEFVRQFKLAGFSANRAAMLLAITPAAASQYVTGKRGIGITLQPSTIRMIKKAVMKSTVPRAALFSACFNEVVEGQIVIKQRVRIHRDDYPYDADKGEEMHG
jgi:predicted transcriptional regulator